MWLRPNRVVTRPCAAGSPGGFDYLWLRSRTIVKLDPRARAALEHSPEVCGCRFSLRHDHHNIV